MRRYLIRGLVGALAWGLACAPAVAHAVTRREVLDRGSVWVRERVPYSQSRWATEQGSLVSTSVSGARYLGYRTDCSGFVSLGLRLRDSYGRPVSLDTASLAVRMSRLGTTTIDASQTLLPGDAVVRPKTATRSGHAVLFVRWIDALHTRYVAFEEAGTSWGTVATERSLATDAANGFRPYRDRSVTETVRPRRSLTWIGAVSAGGLGTTAP